jgi:protein-tyrosine phosphatase
VRWGGLHNARDLGGLAGRLGTTIHGRLFRAPQLDELDEGGWREIEAAGVSTIVDLRNHGEVSPPLNFPASIVWLNQPIEDPHDAEFMAVWGSRLGSPEYYSENLRRWPGKVGAAVTSIADAGPGGVVFHCAGGRDRTGLIAALILELVEVNRELILDDYETGVREANDYLPAHQLGHEQARSGVELERSVRASRKSLEGFLNELNWESFLTTAGVSASSIERLRARLVAR